MEQGGGLRSQRDVRHMYLATREGRAEGRAQVVIEHQLLPTGKMVTSHLEMKAEFPLPPHRVLVLQLVERNSQTEGRERTPFTTVCRGDSCSLGL